MVKSFLILALYLTCSVATAQATEPFLQGPGKINEQAQVRGTVIGPAPGLKVGCYLMLASSQKGPPIGGNGRFFLCGVAGLSQGKIWKGRVRQVDRQLARVGNAWRPLSVFEPTP